MAAAYLEGLGYEIVALKWRESRFELDLVVRKNDLLVFVEVKSSTGTFLGPPEFRVTPTKQKRIAQAASEYLSNLDELPDEIRFDVITVLWNKTGKPRVTHIESAFTADENQ